ncbi:ATP-grasp peptide maturase system methyltransferase [Streptomyces sp. NPDC058683]|uniref:ATP-grasp peptide maturase system methyltransferase n=1 Tax=Streptomyces sp. NPDC058683 TaxID=3346597 RepID=UPI00365D8CBE
MKDPEELHRLLLNTLYAKGALRTLPWRSAATAVHRHEFLRGGFFRPVHNSQPLAWGPVVDGRPEWLEGCYADESLVTQIAGTITATDIRGEIMREPTSSSTLPSLVLRMLEDLLVEPGMNVLEIGTGTGYSTALLCARLGDEHVTSIEYDGEVATQAQTALGRQEMYPGLVRGDGLLGYVPRAPYDRVIATCGVRSVPQAWIEQTRPGGLILVCIGGWLNASELARLTVGEDGTASGPLLGGDISFMLARPQLPPPLGLLPDLSEGDERKTPVASNPLVDWTSRFVIQAAAPEVQRLTIENDGRTEEVLVDVSTGSWAALYTDGDQWIVRQAGPERVWDRAEEQLIRWHTDGQPPLTQFTLHVTPEGQIITW